jgi:hypothetical protein
MPRRSSRSAWNKSTRGASDVRRSKTVGCPTAERRADCSHRPGADAAGHLAQPDALAPTQPIWRGSTKVSNRASKAISSVLVRASDGRPDLGPRESSSPGGLPSVPDPPRRAVSLPAYLDGPAARATTLQQRKTRSGCSTDDSPASNRSRSLETFWTRAAGRARSQRESQRENGVGLPPVARVIL